MWTLWNAVCFRAFVLVVLLVSGVPAKVRWTPSMGFLVGTPPEDEFLGGDGDVGGHGVAEGNGPNGLYGFFGCRFSYAVCQKNEVCVNDNLFGSCQKIGSPFDRYKYDLNENQVQKLTYEVERLVAEGHKWKDLYTQCVLGNVLLAFELNQHYDSNFCKQKPKPERRRSHPADDVIFSIKRLYLKGPLEEEDDLISDYDGDSGPGFSDNPYDTIYARSPSDPNDRAALKWSKYDFVNVHKYQKNRKREPSLDTIMRHSPSPHQRLPEFLARLTPGEVYFLSQIVKMEGQDDGRHGDNNYDDNFVEDAGNKESEDNEGNLPLQFSLDEEPKQEIDRFADGLQDDDGLRLNSDDIYDNLVFLQQGDQDDHPAKIDEEHDLSEEKYEKRFDDPWPEQVEHEDEANRYAAVGSLDDQNYDVEGVKQLANYLQDETLQGEEDSEDVTVKPVKNYKLPGSDIPADMRPNLEQISDSDVSNNIDEELREERGLVTKSVEITTPKAKYDIVDTSYAYLSVLPKTDSMEFTVNLLVELQGRLQLPPDTFSDLSVFNGDINFRINQNPKGLNASSIAVLALSLSNELKNRTGLQIVGAGIGHVSEAYISVEDVKTNGHKYFLLTFVLCGVIAGVVLAVILLYVIRRHRLSQEKLERPSSQSPEKVEPEASKDYQELCRHHMQTKLSEKPEPLHVAGRIGSVSAMENAPVHSPSSRSSTSSWSEEPVTTSMDISTGHIVLSYMEDHLKNKDRLDEEWDALRAYEPEICSVKVAALPQNERRNRYADVLPYDHSRVVLHSATNMTGSDYINASTITDHDPRNPAYLITQGPLPNTVADFWQMIWEQGSVVIVNLTKLTDQGNSLCHCYWPSEGSDLYHIYEVHLVSEHIWCEDYLVRSFYLRNLQTNETRTVTQFHFQTWPDMKIPGTSKALLDFRRKVNKSYRGRSCPILVHCSDGAGRSGTYCLIDMVLNRMTKGAKEIDIAATLEHIRDQRMLMVKTKEQFQFVLTTVAEEVHAILKALPQ